MGGETLGCVPAPRLYSVLSCEAHQSPCAVRAGRQLWEQGTATLESDAAFAAEGDEASVDVSQYERRQDESDDDEVAGAAGRLRLADLSDED